MADLTTQSHAHANRGWVVTFAGLGINLALGVLYAWSMFKEAIKTELHFDDEQLNDPYALCCLVFAAAMIFAGRCQDKIGPRLTATIGGLLIGAGLILISQSKSYGIWLLGFGVLGGLGMGFGYSSATPPALKWFPPAKTGLIAGLVVAGFGLAPVYLAPLSKYLVDNYKLQNSMLYLGIGFLIAIVGLSQFLVNPPAGYVAATAPGSTAKPVVAGSSPSEILRTPIFWVLWLCYFIGSGAGLMVIGSISGMAKKSMGTQAFIAVAVMAIGNASGRVVAGILSDRIGRRATLMLVLLIQAALMFAAIPITQATGQTFGAKFSIVLVAALIGANYGANLSLFPSFTKDLWGIKNFGLNYGVLFTAWGVGGLILPRVQQMLTKNSGGSFQSSFITAGALLIIGAALTMFIKPKPVSA